jgi:LmbE family N-acetylglucosaminyl deacetylase
MSKLAALADLHSRRCVITAHPDDETLWCGGLLITHPGDWTIICCSIPMRDPVRAVKFHNACFVLGAKGIVLNRVEVRLQAHTWLDDLGDLGRYDLLVTHNPVGEYGHRAHVGVFQYVAERWQDQALMFGYGVDGFTHPDPVLSINLTDEQFAKKRRALQAYDNLMSFRGAQMPTWQALLSEYGEKFNLRREDYYDADQHFMRWRQQVGW